MSINHGNLDYCYIEGDGIGPDVITAARLVADHAYKKVYGDDAKINRIELEAGRKSILKNGTGLPQETIDAIAKYKLAVKGPMGTPIGTGDRSYNVALRTKLDLYACIRPIKYYDGIPTKYMTPWGINAVLFRENIEDLYSGHELPAQDAKTIKLIRQMNEEFDRDIPDFSSIGIKNMSQYNTNRISKAAADYAIKNDYKLMTYMHKGNIMKLTEGNFMKRGYDYIKNNCPEFITQRQQWILQNHASDLSIDANARKLDGTNFDLRTSEKQQQIVDEVKITIEQLRKGEEELKSKKIVNDMIADNTFQQTFLRPQKFGVLVAPNLNGDYESDAFAAVVGGLGVCGGVNVNFETGVVMPESIHGTADDRPKDVANPMGAIISTKLGFEFSGHPEVAKYMDIALGKQLLTGRVTLDLTESADDIYKTIKAQSEKGSGFGVKHLLRFAKEQKKRYNTIGTTQFAEEICQQMDDINL